MRCLHKLSESLYGLKPSSERDNYLCCDCYVRATAQIERRERERDKKPHTHSWRKITNTWSCRELKAEAKKPVEELPTNIHSTKNSLILYCIPRFSSATFPLNLDLSDFCACALPLSATNLKSCVHRWAKWLLLSTFYCFCRPPNLIFVVDRF